MKTTSLLSSFFHAPLSLLPRKKTLQPKTKQLPLPTLSSLPSPASLSPASLSSSISLTDLPNTTSFMTDSTIESIEEIDIQKMGPGYVAFFDLDDTIITNHPSLFMRTNVIQCKNEAIIVHWNIFQKYLLTLTPRPNFDEFKGKQCSPSIGFYIEIINLYQTRTPRVATEQGAVSNLIKQLTKQGVEVHVATARRPGRPGFTEQQLKNVGLEVGKNKDIRSILFCGDSSKQFKMKSLLEQRSQRPLGAIFVDNNHEEINEILSHLNRYVREECIPFHCYEYQTQAAVDNLLKTLSKEKVLELMKYEFNAFIEHYRKHGRDDYYVPAFGLPSSLPIFSEHLQGKLTPTHTLL